MFIFDLSFELKEYDLDFTANVNCNQTPLFSFVIQRFDKIASKDFEWNEFFFQFSIFLSEFLISLDIELKEK